MGTTKRILENTALLTAGKVAGDAVVFVFLMYFGRVFGKALLGKYALAMSIGAILSVLYSFGFNTLLTREVSRDKSHGKKYVGNLLLARTVLSLAVWFLLSIGIVVAPLSTDTKLIVILITGYHVFYRLGGLLRAAFIAHEAMRYPSLMELFHRIVILCIGSLCVFLLKNPVITLAVYPISSCMMFFLGLTIYQAKFGRLDFHLDFSFVKKAVVVSFPFLLITILTQFYGRVGIIILTAVRGEAEAGLYAASDRLFVTLTTTLTMLSASLLPVMSRYAKEEKESLIRLVLLAGRWLAITLIPFSATVSLFSEEIITVTFGADFADSAVVLRVLSLALILIGLNYVLSNFLIVENREGLLVRIRLAIYCFHIFFSLVLIWLFHYPGLAYARLVSELMLFIVMFVCIRSSVKTMTTSGNDNLEVKE